MNILKPQYFDRFQCACGNCPDTCCASWEVIIDSDTLCYYESLPGDFGQRLRQALCVMDGEPCFKTNSGVCPMLTPDGLCSVHQELGEEHLCNVCKAYPRWIQEYGAMQLQGLSLSCPEVARLVLSQSCSTVFCTEENDTPVTSYNTLDPSRFLLLAQARRVLISIAQNRAYPPAWRACLALEFGRQLQRTLTARRYQKGHALCQTFSSAGQLQDLTRCLTRRKEGSSFQNIRRLVQAFMTLEILTPQWSDMLGTLFSHCQDDRHYEAQAASRAEFQVEFQESAVQYEHILVYFLDKYSLKACYDGDILGKVKLAAISLLVTMHWDFLHYQTHRNAISLSEQVEFVHRYCRELEHSEDNLAQLGRLLRRRHWLSANRLIQQFAAI